MKYLCFAALIATVVLFARCNSKNNPEPATTFDTLGVRWMVIEKDNIIYHFQERGVGTDEAMYYMQDHELAYVILNQTFKATLPHKLRFFIWTDTALATRIFNHVLGFTYSKQCICHVRINQTLGHEMTHALSYWAQGVETTSYTRLVTEGVAVAFDLSGRNLIEMAKSALSGKDVASITELWDGYYENSDQLFFYPIAGAFMDYMYKQSTAEEFNALLKKQTRYEAQDIYGEERLNKLIAGFDALVGL